LRVDGTIRNAFVNNQIFRTYDRYRRLVWKQLNLLAALGNKLTIAGWCQRNIDGRAIRGRDEKHAVTLREFERIGNARGEMRQKHAKYGSFFVFINDNFNINIACGTRLTPMLESIATN